MRGKGAQKELGFKPSSPGGIADTGLSIPGGPSYTNLTALSVHYYCPLYQMRDPSKDTNLTMSLCADVGDVVFDSQAFDVHNTGMEGAALFLTEWGECDPRIVSGCFCLHALLGDA